MVIKNALTFDPKKTSDLQPVLGNHVIVKMKEAEVYVFFAYGEGDLPGNLEYGARETRRLLWLITPRAGS